MNPLIIRAVFSLFVLSIAASGAHAQAPTPAARTAAPLGLLRLQDTAKPGAAAALVSNKFAVDELSAGAVPGAGKSRKDDVNVLTLDANQEWSRALRGSPHEVSFISFQLHASASTLVDIGGARLGLTLSPINGSLQLMYDDSATGTLRWKSLNFHLGAVKYGGKSFAALPTLTVRLDPGTGTWDLFLGSRLLADSLPMIAARKDQSQFSVRAGGEGAWLTGLVMADENPLYEDANANGIDDAFERQKRGALAAASAPVADRKLLAQEWQDAQRKKAPPAPFVKRPLPDAVVAGR